jgi:DNA-binding response OmpR family regulator
MKSSRARILHAEDDEDNRDLIAFVLTHHNCEWVGAATHEEALRLAKEGGFNLFLLDSRLPDLSGLDLCKRIREFDSQTPILFYSAAATEKDKHAAMTSGAQGYVTKPADPGDLMTEVFRLMREFPT